MVGHSETNGITSPELPHPVRNRAERRRAVGGRETREGRLPRTEDGYVAGRLARFDGKRQGVGVWLFSLLNTIALAVAAVILGSEYNLLAQLNQPGIPVDEGSLTTGGIIALVATPFAAVAAVAAGGKVGEDFHRKVDRVAA